MNTPEQLGPYRIESVLGKGGMGRVYKATHADSGDQVAIKALSPQLAMNEGFIDRFRAEIESLRLLRHASIVRLFGYGQEGDTLFYAMELVDGPSIDDEIRNGRRFTWREVTDIGIQICRALKHAHDHGVIHRDIKPANILLTDAGKVKLADFGIARLFGGAQLTISGGVIGTADYMSPEQVSGDGVTSQCDQYSLGGVMFAMLAGRPPFVAKALPQMLQLQRYAEAEPVTRFAPETPKQLEETIAQMLSKSPADRFPNTLVLAKHLEAMLRALTRKPSPADEPPMGATTPRSGPGKETMDEVLGPNSVTQDYDLSAAEGGSTQEELIVARDDDQTPAVAEMLTSRHHRESPTVASTPPAGIGVEKPKKKSLFTEVGVDRPADTTPRWVLATQGIAALLLVGAFGWLGYRLLQPPTADSLHTRIEQTLEPGDTASLRAVARDVESFLARFPDDPRVESLAEVCEAIEFDRQERQLKLKMLFRKTPDATAPPVEQLYFRAMQLSASDPSRAISQFEAMATLIDANGSADATLCEYAALARRQVERLREEDASEETTHRPFVEEQLRQARELSEEQPDQSRKLCEAVIALYEGRVWAAPLVEQARSLVQEIREE